MDIRAHGGNCCGVRHIYGMDHGTEAALQRLIEQLDNERGQGNRLIEVILSERQVRNDAGMAGRNPPDGWPAILLRNGFRLVSRFNNSNSRNDCYIFHRVPNFKSIRPADLPFAWTHNNRAENLDAGGAGRAARPAPVPVRAVATFYANFLQRTQARGGLFNTLELARNAAPNCQRRDKLEIMSDGTQRWTDNVRV